jgi:hypothetical protein
LELQLVASQVECIAKSAPVFHKQIVQSFFEEFEKLVIEMIMAASPA